MGFSYNGSICGTIPTKPRVLPNKIHRTKNGLPLSEMLPNAKCPLDSWNKIGYCPNYQLFQESDTKTLSLNTARIYVI